MRFFRCLLWEDEAGGGEGDIVLGEDDAILLSSEEEEGSMAFRLLIGKELRERENVCCWRRRISRARRKCVKESDFRKFAAF